MKKYSIERKVSYYTYSMNTIKNELTRYFVKCQDNINRGDISLDAVSKEDGLLYSELYGSIDEGIKSFTHDTSIREIIREGSLVNDDLDIENLNERIHILMLELTGQNTLSRKEIINLKRRIKYWMDKKDKDND